MMTGIYMVLQTDIETHIVHTHTHTHTRLPAEGFTREGSNQT